MIFTSGHGVNGFMLDPSIGEFVLTDPNMQVGQVKRTEVIVIVLSKQMHYYAHALVWQVR